MKPSWILFIALSAGSLFLPAPMPAQVISFKKEIHTEGYPYAMDVRQTPDGYVIAGEMQGLMGPKHLYLVKTDLRGDTVWTREFGDTTSGRAVATTSDGGFAVVGVRATYASLDESTYVVKTDSIGNVDWQIVFCAPCPCNGYSIQQTEERSYVITGVAGGDIFLAKLDSVGNILWSRTYGGNLLDAGNWVSETYDHGYVIAGYTRSFGAGLEDAYLIRTDPVGDTLWTRTFGGEFLDRAYSVQQTADSGFILGGFTESIGEGYDGYLIRTNSNGDTLWTRHLGGVGHQHGKVVRRNPDNTYVLGGPPTDISGSGNMILMKLTQNGTAVWNRSFSDVFGGEALQQTTDGGYIMVGHNMYAQGIVLVKTDETGILPSVVTRQYTVGSGWNLVSVPLTVSDYRKTTLFPSSISPAYGFDASGGYVQRDTLKNGSGYWLKFDSAQTVTMSGVPHNVDTIDVRMGWNIIGSISYPVIVDSIFQTPSGVVISDFFGYGGTYTPVDTLYPAKGYWVKASGAGSLILSSGTALRGRIGADAIKQERK